MNDAFKTKVIKFIIFIVIASIFACVSYQLVYKISFLPNGYDIISEQNSSVTIKSFNLLGSEKDIQTLTFNEDEIWKIGQIHYNVTRLKEFLWLLYFSVSVSTFLLIYKIRTGVKLWRAFFESNIFVSVLLPLLTIINSLNRIQDYIY
jgi:hypothetical protein